MHAARASGRNEGGRLGHAHGRRGGRRSGGLSSTWRWWPD